MTGRIFDVKRYSIHDGPGIRTTVFFKGCPLHCLWCHNPEGIDFRPELMHSESRCAHCHACATACPRGAIAGNGASAVRIERDKCDLCGACAEACVYDAMQVVGREVSVAELLGEIERDRIFFEQSGGGATFSGGDPLSQPDFLEELLDALRSRGIPTAVDTSAFAPGELVDRIAAKAGLVLGDLKFVNDAKHREFTGVTNAPILENLKRLAEGPAEVWVRMPLLAGVNDGEEDIRAAVAFLGSLPKIRTVGLLPYHSGGFAKARRLGTEASFRTFEPPTAERYAAIEADFRKAGFLVHRGG
jgi:pyruvate formate lyase activating enzyme